MLLIPPRPFTITARSEAGLGAAGDLFSWTAPLAVFFVNSSGINSFSPFRPRVGILSLIISALNTKYSRSASPSPIGIRSHCLPKPNGTAILYMMVLMMFSTITFKPNTLEINSPKP